MKIGVFDSGIGGEAVARDLRIAFPNASIVTVSDRANLPYGSKQPDEVIRLTLTAVAPLVEAECDIIVIACNTATTIAFTTLTAHYPSQRFIGVEPMVSEASALTLSKTICICATPGTLGSDRYRALKDEIDAGIIIIEPDCHDWASMIERNDITIDAVRRDITPALDEGADVIVLGCTHYHWIKELVESIARGRAVVIEPTNTIVEHIEQMSRDYSSLTAATN